MLNIEKPENVCKFCTSDQKLRLKTTTLYEDLKQLLHKDDIRTQIGMTEDMELNTCIINMMVYIDSFMT